MIHIISNALRIKLHISIINIIFENKEGNDLGLILTYEFDSFQRGIWIDL